MVSAPAIGAGHSIWRDSQIAESGKTFGIHSSKSAVLHLFHDYVVSSSRCDTGVKIVQKNVW